MAENLYLKNDSAKANMKYSVRTHKGLIREINQDNYKIIENIEGIPPTFIIADGMGGHKAGEVASLLAVSNSAKYLIEDLDVSITSENLPKKINDAICYANKKLIEKSSESLENSGMGTTAIISMIFENKLYIGHVGDSRVYLIRDKKLKKLTTDHSYIEELLKNATITEEEALNHPQKHLITRALGSEEELLVDIYIYDVRKGDIFLMCTDGLTNMISEENILEYILSTEDINYLCDKFIEESNKNGGEDNITVIVFKDE